MGFFDGGFGGIVSGVLGAIGGTAGSALDAAHDRDLARMNQNWQREVYQNQLQWKAADARKAGLHPLAALGGGSYSASNIASSSGSSYAQSLGKLGEGIGDAFTAYMNKDEIAEQLAADKAKADNKFNKEMDLIDAQIQEIRARTRESLNRSLSYTRPMATGRETIPGQVDVPEGFPQPKQRTGLISNPKSAIYVWYMGNGQYDITFNPDYTQAIGDETGQFINMLKAGTRPSRYYDVDLGRVFYYNHSTGYYQDIDPAIMRSGSSGGGGAAGAWTTSSDGEPFSWAKYIDGR